MLFDWPTAMLPSLGHRYVGGRRRERLGHRGVGAAVHDAERLANPVLHRHPRARRSLLASSISKPEHLVQRPLRTGRSRPPGRSPGAGYRSALVATFDQLSAEQRAIVELVLRRGKDYDAARPTCSTCRSRVCASSPARRSSTWPRSAPRRRRGLARPARRLRARASRPAPRPPPRAGTCGAPSPRARGRARCSTRWTSSTTTAPCRRSPRASAAGTRCAGADAPAGGRSRSPAADVTTPPARALALAPAALAAVVLLVVLVWPIGLLTGDDDDGDGSGQPPRRRPAPRPATRLAGAAVVLGQGKQRAVQVQATGCPRRARSKFAYQFWLYNGKNNANSLGAQVTDTEAAPCRRVGHPAGRLREVPLLRPVEGADRRPQGALGRLGAARPRCLDARGPTQVSRAGEITPRCRRRSRSPSTVAGALASSRPSGSSFPGFMTPAGSSRSFAARSSSMPQLPTSAASQGAWSRPIAWWWVIVPPLADDRVATPPPSPPATASSCVRAPGARGR